MRSVHLPDPTMGPNWGPMSELAAERSQAWQIERRTARERAVKPAQTFDPVSHIFTISRLHKRKIGPAKS